MALNLWTNVGKLPSSYNPLPGGYFGMNTTTGNDYQISFYASSKSSGYVRVSDNVTTNTVWLSPTRKLYTIVFNKSNANFWINDEHGYGDIIIDSISLVQKPLPKNTINGIDGFLSGKWTLHANATVQDDQTLVLNATANSWQRSSLLVNALPNQTYSIYMGSGTTGRTTVDFLDSSQTYISSTSSNQSFTTPANCSYIKIWLDNSITNSVNGANPTVGTFTFSQPQLNLGSTPAPFSKKTDPNAKMVMPVAKKNIFDGVYVQNAYYDSSGVLQTGNINNLAVQDFIPVRPNTSYTLSGNQSVTVGRIIGYDASKNFVSVLGASVSMPYTVTIPFNVYYVKYHFQTSNYSLLNQLEPGTTATTYTPYAVQENKKPTRVNTANKGLNMNYGDYIDCGTFLNTALQGASQFTIDMMVNPASLVGSQGTWAWFFTTNDDSGASHYGFYIGNGSNSDGSVVFTCHNNGIQSSTKMSIGNWYRITATFNNGVLQLFINGVSQGTANAGISTLAMNTIPTRINNAGYYSSPTWKATYKYVRVYNSALTTSQIDANVNSNLLFNYDFTNPKNIVGNTVLTGQTNLIPAFDSELWTINANAQVMGKDSLHLNATGGDQQSIVFVNALQNTNYLFNSTTSNGIWQLCFYDSNSRQISCTNVTNGSIYTTPTNTTQIRVGTRNNGSGSFDFIRPQLYQLSGQEGTINGSPILNNKFPKQRLYAKR